MSYNVRAFKVFIASPGDVSREREIVRSVIERWNSVNSESTKIILVPIGWETNAAPEMGRTAQDYINMDILDSCDVVIGIFWTRVGTPTRNHVGGSIEEVLRPSENRRLTMLYFSNKLIQPDCINTKQYKQLIDFKEKVKKCSLYSEFSDERDLSEKLYQHIQVKINEGKFRVKWDSDIIAAIGDDNLMAQEIRNHFPLVAENVLKSIIYQQHSDEVWDAIVERLSVSPPRLSESLLFIARMGACRNIVFAKGCPKLAETNQAEFCVFLNNLYSINRYEFGRLFDSGLLTDVNYMNFLNGVIQSEKEI